MLRQLMTLFQETYHTSHSTQIARVLVNYLCYSTRAITCENLLHEIDWFFVAV